MSQDSSSSTKASVLSSTCLTPSAPLSPNLEEEEEEQFHFLDEDGILFYQEDRLSNRELFVSSLMDFSHLGLSSPSTNLFLVVLGSFLTRYGILVQAGHSAIQHLGEKFI